MTNNIKKHQIILAVVLMIVAFLLVLFLYAPADAGKKGLQTKDPILAEKIQRKLNDIPEYGVFDWISFTVNGNGKVSLKGWAIFTETKSEAYKEVYQIKEVLEIDNQIIVLPNSKIDNRIRNSAWAKLEQNSRLETLVEGANPVVHIIVNLKKIKLFGKVKNKSESELIESMLKKIKGVTEVRNYLEVS